MGIFSPKTSGKPLQNINFTKRKMINIIVMLLHIRNTIK